MARSSLSPSIQGSSKLQLKWTVQNSKDSRSPPYNNRVVLPLKKQDETRILLRQALLRCTFNKGPQIRRTKLDPTVPIPNILLNTKFQIAQTIVCEKAKQKTMRLCVDIVQWKEKPDLTIARAVSHTYCYWSL